MDLSVLAQALLDTAAPAVPDVSRRFIAAGPEFARPCTLLAVYASTVNVRALSGIGGGMQVTGGCSVTVGPQVTLVYARDCYPMPDDSKRPPKLPDPADLTAWSTTFLDGCQRIVDAVADAVYAGTFGSCDQLALLPATFTGPSGGVATMQLPVGLT